MKSFTVRENEAGQRLDKYLRKLLPDAPGSFIYKMLRKKNIKLNRAKAEGNEILKTGDSIQLFLAEETIDSFREAVTFGSRLRSAPAAALRGFLSGAAAVLL